MKIFTIRFNTLLFSTFFLFVFNISSQNKIEQVCGTIMTPESLAYLNEIKPKLKKYEQEFFKMYSDQNRSATTLSSIPIKAHIIRTSAGTGGLSISDLNDAISNMNAFYTNAFMEFYLCDGINYIDDDNFYDFETSDEGSLTGANNVSGLINIYFTDYIASNTGSSLCGYAYSPGGNDVILMANNCTTNGSTLPHEIGHFFSLIHTHGPNNSFLTNELVNGSNCDTDGDQICDTPADPQLNIDNVDVSCVYTGTTSDANGDLFAPDPENIMSYSRKECRVHFSVQQYARIYASYQTARNYFACPSFNVSFSTDIAQDCSNTLTVNFTDTSTGATSWQWDVDGDDVIDYTTQNPTHDYSQGVYTVTLTISNGSDSISKTFFELIEVGASETVPLNEDFEIFANAGDNGWTTNDISGNGYDWISNSGGTPSDGTGPLVDNTNKDASGTYIYAEASGSTSGNVAEYISPCITINTFNAQLEFAYHMFGVNIGELHVDIETDSGYINDVIPAIIGQQQTSQSDPYLSKKVDLSAYATQTIKIRFRAIRGVNWDSDIAIDDFTITENLLSIDSKELQNIKIYPNPVTTNSINVESNFLGEIVNYEIVNLLGQTILKGILSNKQINVGNLSSGTYFLILKHNTLKTIKKFVKY